MGKVLVVDDNASVRHALSLVLQDEGYEVIQVESGESALRMCCAQEFDLLITDLTMDGMSGLELLDTLRERGIMTPVILMSALNSHYLELFTRKFAFERVLSKPADVDLITSAVAEALARRPRNL
jgi:CheY-like chemotaxis protein